MSGVRKLRFECAICHTKYVATGPAQKYCKICIPNATTYHRYMSWGINQSQWDQLLQAQGNACAICKRPFDFTISKKRGLGIFIDHNHVTGHMRGILCNGCNHGLAWIEKPGWLDAASHYLQEHVQ